MHIYIYIHIHICAYKKQISINIYIYTYIYIYIYISGLSNRTSDPELCQGAPAGKAARRKRALGESDPESYPLGLWGFRAYRGLYRV